MTLHLPRPCPYGKGGQDAHDEEELYFHCELSPGPFVALFLAALYNPSRPRPTPFLQPTLVSPCIPVKVPTRRTFLDPQSCGDPLQAVHLFAKELDAKTVTLEKSLGAGKPGSQEALSIPRAPTCPPTPPLPPGPPSLPSPQSQPAQEGQLRTKRDPQPPGYGEGDGGGVCDPAFLPSPGAPVPLSL